MWKDYFYFSRGQRMGIIVFIGVILLTFAVRWTLPYFFDSKPVWMTPAFQLEVDSFLQSVVVLDSLKEESFKFNPTYSNTFHKTTYQKQVPVLEYFDPNTLDSAGFVQLGVKPYIAKNILKFRSRGGKFKNAGEFAKVYGLSPEMFQTLQPYIQIILSHKDSIQKEDIQLKKNDHPVIVELNSADTSQLLQIKGIGRYLAFAIIRFRQLSGGYISVAQLKDIKGMTEENYLQMSQFCTVNTEKINKIKVNFASVDKLKSHPYLGFYKAKSLYEYRRKVGKLKNLDEIGELADFSEDDIRKISPYLSFE